MHSQGSGFAGSCAKESVWSAPARLVENVACLLPDCHIWTGDFSTSMKTLRPGEMFRCGMAEATVKSVRTLQPRVRNLVTITYAVDDLEGFLTLTDDHALQVRCGCMPACVVEVCQRGPESRQLGLGSNMESCCEMNIFSNSFVKA